MVRTSSTFLTTEEVAGMLRVDERTVQRLVKDGTIEAVRVGRQYRITPGGLQRYLRVQGYADEAVLTPHSAEIIAVVNQKGGVGKTTTVLNLASLLGAMGKACLVVDLDAQANLTQSFGFNPEDLAGTVYDGMLALAKPSRPGRTNPTAPRSSDEQEVAGRLNILDAGGGVELLPGNIDLASADMDLASVPYIREQLLAKLLRPLRSRYDYILIDCGPNLSLLTVNALVAASWVMIPTQAAYLSVRGIQALFNSIVGASEINPDLEILGLVLTMVDERVRLARATVQNVKTRMEQMGIRVFDTVIKRGATFEEASAERKSLLQYEPGSPHTQAYQQLLDECLEVIRKVEEEREARQTSTPRAALRSA